MPRSVASDLGLHYLPMSHKMNARLIWIRILRECEYCKFRNFCGGFIFAKFQENKIARNDKITLSFTDID